jgi:hypothetical protein
MKYLIFGTTINLLNCQIFFCLYALKSYARMQNLQIIMHNCDWCPAPKIAFLFLKCGLNWTQKSTGNIVNSLGAKSPNFHSPNWWHIYLISRPRSNTHGTFANKTAPGHRITEAIHIVPKRERKEREMEPSNETRLCALWTLVWIRLLWQTVNVIRAIFALQPEFSTNWSARGYLYERIESLCALCVRAARWKGSGNMNVRGMKSFAEQLYLVLCARWMRIISLCVCMCIYGQMECVYF